MDRIDSLFPEYDGKGRELIREAYLIAEKSLEGQTRGAAMGRSSRSARASGCAPQRRARATPSTAETIPEMASSSRNAGFASTMSRLESSTPRRESWFSPETEDRRSAI